MCYRSKKKGTERSFSHTDEHLLDESLPLLRVSYEYVKAIGESESLGIFISKPLVLTTHYDMYSSDGQMPYWAHDLPGSLRHREVSVDSERCVTACVVCLVSWISHSTNPVKKRALPVNTGICICHNHNS